MSDQTLGWGRDVARPQISSSNLYRAVWRWHFYAGLLVLPFLITLAITGALYLFKDEIDGLVHADLKRVEVQATATKVAPSAMVAAALTTHPGTATKFTNPATASSSAEVTVKTASGETLAVYVNPYGGQVLGTLPDRGTVMWTIRTLHSLKYFGTVMRAFIEIAAGWSILLVGTGIYLWWPRRQAGGVVSVRGTPRKRAFWRDTHAVTGIFVGFFIVFLAITGMPWSNVWGGKVNEWANGHNFGYPAGVRVAVPMSDEHLSHVSPTTWSLERARIPESGGQAHGAEPIGLDKAVGIFDDMGLHRGYTVAVPALPKGVYSASVYPDDLSQQRVVHLHQYSGKPLIDMSYADYGPLGKWLGAHGPAVWPGEPDRPAPGLLGDHDAGRLRRGDVVEAQALGHARRATGSGGSSCVPGTDRHPGDRRHRVPPRGCLLAGDAGSGLAPLWQKRSSRLGIESGRGHPRPLFI
jgi:uncharacterized iron-regulated membrane protein